MADPDRGSAPSAMHRQRRGRNIALLVVLLALVVLFYLITIARMGGS